VRSLTLGQLPGTMFAHLLHPATEISTRRLLCLTQRRPPRYYGGRQSFVQQPLRVPKVIDAHYARCSREKKSTN